MVRSPRLAAIGVATLSGLIWHLRENITTTIITEPETFNLLRLRVVETRGKGVIIKGSFCVGH